MPKGKKHRLSGSAIYIFQTVGETPARTFSIIRRQGAYVITTMARFGLPVERACHPSAQTEADFKQEIQTVFHVEVIRRG